MQKSEIRKPQYYLFWIVAVIVLTSLGCLLSGILISAGSI